MSVTPATQIINLQSSDTAFTSVQSEQVLSADSLSVIRLEVPAGEEIPHHSVAEPSTLHCLSGQVLVAFDEEEVQLSEHQMILLDAHRPHVVKAKSNSVLLVTMQNPEALHAEQVITDSAAAQNSVDEAAEESFPASDPPAFNNTAQ